MIINFGEESSEVQNPDDPEPVSDPMNLSDAMPSLESDEEAIPVIGVLPPAAQLLGCERARSNPIQLGDGAEDINANVHEAMDIDSVNEDFVIQSQIHDNQGITTIPIFEA